jgi:hypothetical protein
MVRVKPDVGVADLRGWHASPATAAPELSSIRSTRHAASGMTLAGLRGVSGVRVFVQVKIDQMRRRHQSRMPVSPVG